MKQKRLTGTTVPRFTYDTPTQAENDFYALCAGETPLVMVFLPNIGHPISRAYLTAYLETLPQLSAGRIACVVRSSPQRIAARFGQGVQFPFPLICDAEGVLYDYFGVQNTTSFFDWTFAARRIVNEAKKEGYQPQKGEAQMLPLTLVMGEEGKVLYAHRGRSLTDLPEDCEAIQQVCEQLALRRAKAAQQAQPTQAVQDAQDAQAAPATVEAQTAPAQNDAASAAQGEDAPQKIALDWFDEPTQ